MKTCKCGFFGEDTEFRKNRMQCKTCWNKYKSEYRKTEKHKQYVREYDKKTILKRYEMERAKILQAKAEERNNRTAKLNYFISLYS